MFQLQTIICDSDVVDGGRGAWGGGLSLHTMGVSIYLPPVLFYRTTGVGPSRLPPEKQLFSQMHADIYMSDTFRCDNNPHMNLSALIPASSWSDAQAP